MLKLSAGLGIRRLASRKWSMASLNFPSSIMVTASGLMKPFSWKFPETPSSDSAESSGWAKNPNGPSR